MNDEENQTEAAHEDSNYWFDCGVEDTEYQDGIDAEESYKDEEE